LPSVPVGACQHVGDGGVVVELEPLGLGQRALQLPPLNGRRKIQQRPRQRRDRHAVVDDRVARGKRTRLMNQHARHSVAAVGDGDLDARSFICEQITPGPGAAMAEHGTLAASEDRGQRSSLAAESRMADGVDAAMHAMKAAHA
jgi:hypothetical protein